MSAPPQQEHEEIEPDEFDDVDEGADGLSIADSTTSVISSIYQGVDQYGRRYGKGDYGMPIDEDELDRIDLKHRLYQITLHEKHYLAPIGQHPQRILDLGTGSGIWAIEMADMFPSATVLGVDLAPIQPDWIPPNCRFELDDVEEEWTFRDPFDFIHARDFLFSIHDWPKLVGQCYEFTKPGGYTELQCLLPLPRCDDGSAPADSGIVDFSHKVCDGSEIAGWSLREPTNYARYMRQAGFVDVVEQRFPIPTSPWPKDRRMKLMGAFEMQSLLQGASAFSLRCFGKAYGWTREQTEVYLVKMRRDARNLRYHVYYEFVVVYGKKPSQSSHSAPADAVSLVDSAVDVESISPPVGIVAMEHPAPSNIP